jgi:hypothetical protein
MHNLLLSNGFTPIGYLLAPLQELSGLHTLSLTPSGHHGPTAYGAMNVVRQLTALRELHWDTAERKGLLRLTRLTQLTALTYLDGFNGKPDVEVTLTSQALGVEQP